MASALTASPAGGYSFSGSRRFVGSVDPVMSPDRTRPLAAVVAAALLAAAPASAQAPGWTLPAAIEQAIAANEISGIAAARLEGATALRRQAIAQLLPALTLSANATRRAREVTRTIEDD